MEGWLSLTKIYRTHIFSICKIEMLWLSHECYALCLLIVGCVKSSLTWMGRLPINNVVLNQWEIMDNNSREQVETRSHALLFWFTSEVVLMKEKKNRDRHLLREIFQPLHSYFSFPVLPIHPFHPRDSFLKITWPVWAPCHHHHDLLEGSVLIPHYNLNLHEMNYFTWVSSKYSISISFRFVTALLIIYTILCFQTFEWRRKTSIYNWSRAFTKWTQASASRLQVPTKTKKAKDGETSR